MAIAPVAQWVAEAVRRCDGSQAELARRVSKELRRELDRSMINKMVLNRRIVHADELLAIEAVTGLPSSFFRYRRLTT